MNGPQRFTAPPGRAAAISGWGIAVPKGRLTNQDWVERVNAAERRVAAAGESTATLAIEAGAAAIKAADLSPADIGACIVATVTPEQPIPFTGAFVQDRLGLHCGAFDIDAACSGFVYGLVVGASLLATASVNAVLVIGSETLLRITDWEDRSTAVLFGDGAGAVVLTPSDEAGLLAWDLGCDGSAAHLLSVAAGGSRLPTSAETVAAGQHYLRMEGQEVFRRAVRAIVDSAAGTLEQAGYGVDDVDCFIPHQANQRIIDSAATRLGIPPERTFVNLERYGNTSAASIPLALGEAADAGRLKPGDLVLLSGFGAGMSWGSALVRWTAPSD